MEDPAQPPTPLSVEQVVDLASELAKALGPEPDEATYDAASDWDPIEGRQKTPDEYDASEVERIAVLNWHRLTTNAEVFLCDAVGWDIELLAAAEQLTPDRDPDADLPFDRWTLISWALLKAWRAVAEPLETKPDGRGSMAEELASHFTRQAHHILPLNAAAFRACDQEVALRIFDRVLADGPGDLIDGRVLTAEEVERARVDLILWQPAGRDERWRRSR